MGCTRCSTYILSLSDERAFEDNFAFHRERLSSVVDILADAGIDLGLEFLGPKTLQDGHEHEFIHTAADAATETVAALETVRDRAGL